MIDGDKINFAGLLDGCAEYYSKPISKMLKKIYWNGLKSYEINEISSAITRHIKSPDQGQFFPKVADLVKILDGSSADNAQLAWSKVFEALQRTGTYRSVVFDDPIIHRVIADMGGWPVIGEKKEDELPFIANEFRTRYRAWRSRGEAIDYYPRVLPGLQELCNSAYGPEWYTSRGLPEPAPVYIGEPEKCKAIMCGKCGVPEIAKNSHTEKRLAVLVSDCIANI